jgi:DNA-binding CsgD family transcriptional regulator
LLPHLRRALAFRRQIGGLRFDANALRAILDQAPFAIMLAEGSGRIIYSNQGADRICKLDDGIRLAGSRLRLSRAEDRISFETALNRVSDPSNPHYGEQWIFPVPRRSGKADFQLALMPVRISSSNDSPNQYIQLFIYDPTHREPLHGEALQSLHGLTDAETKVCELLYSDSDLNEVSHYLNISVNTVKTHLARIFQKIGVNSQKELMKYLAQAPKVGARKVTTRPE